MKEWAVADVGRNEEEGRKSEKEFAEEESVGQSRSEGGD